MASRPEVVESVAPAKEKNRKDKLVRREREEEGSRLHQGWRAPASQSGWFLIGAIMDRLIIAINSR